MEKITDFHASVYAAALSNIEHMKATAEQLLDQYSRETGTPRGELKAELERRIAEHERKA